MTSHWLQAVAAAFAGASGMALLGHAVNTFPTPANKYGIWLLGVIQFAVGQRVAAANTFQGLQTIAAGVTTQEKANIDAGKSSSSK